MSIKNPVAGSKGTMPDFDDLADVFWRLGVIQSPAYLQGYLLGLLAVGDPLPADQWLQRVKTCIDPVQAPDDEDKQKLLALYNATRAPLLEGELGLQLLLPDDAVEVSQRIDAIAQWCQGFMAGFAVGGKTIQHQQGQQQYSRDVSEALTDIAAISQIGLSDEDNDQLQCEHDMFEISEYLRLAAINIYMECHQPATVSPVTKTLAADETPLGSPGGLFRKSDHRLH